VGLLAVAHEPASAALVRQSIADDLVDHHVTAESVDDVVLVASELVTNAVVHAPFVTADLNISWQLHPDSVVIEVIDNSPDLPRRRSPIDTDTRGRGLFIVAALALDWGVRRTEGGKRVWARIPIRSIGE
jgi:anti-sigma regulatory factor (Ser/Thr protein kinase)